MATAVNQFQEPARFVMVPQSEQPGIPIELQDKLKAPLPPEAVTQHPSKSYLSSIKPAYVIERMNDVFGIGSYHETYREISVSSREQERERNGKTYKVAVFVATVHGTLEIPRYGIHLENFGGSENDDAGDALKGAATDAFTKMCSHLGIGMDVYKGKGRHGNQQQPKKAPASVQKPPQANGQAMPQKITISGRAGEVKKDGSAYWMELVGEKGKYLCGSQNEEVIKALMRANGKNVELLVTPVNTSKGPAHQVHKICRVDWKGEGQ